MTGVLLRGAARASAGGRSLIDPRIEARRQEVARDRGRRRRRKLVAFAVFTVVVLASFGLLRSPLFDVDHVRVTGAARTDPSAVVAAARIDTGQPMTAVDLHRAAAAVERLPWVADATVTRDWPGTVRIRIIERVPAAVAGQGVDQVLVDRDGRILGSAVHIGALPNVGALPAGYVPGRLLPAPQRELSRVLAAMPAELTAEVASLGHGRAGLEARLRSGIVVVIGDSAQVRAKFEAVAALLDRVDPATVRAIDVSVPSAPALTPTTPAGA